MTWTSDHIILFSEIQTKCPNYCKRYYSNAINTMQEAKNSASNDRPDGAGSGAITFPAR